MITAAVVVFQYTTQQESEDFEVRFTDFAYQIIGVYEVNADKIIGTYENFALEITAIATSSALDWPFMTIPAFEAQATGIMGQTGSRSFGVAHFVQPDEVEAWVNYTLQNQWWKQEGLDYHGSNETATPVVPFIWGDFRNFGPLPGPLEEYGFYAPIWQTPIVNGVISNFDSFRLGTYPAAYERMMESNGPLLTQVRNLGEDATTGFGDGRPESAMMVPIYREVRKEQHNASHIVATITSLLPWDRYFIDLLPDGIDGILLVISNTCNQTFSYEINGPTVEYLGEGDHHDPIYDEYLVETAFSPFETEMECLHTLSLYPSATFESSYETDKPKIYTIAVICIFLLTVGVFILYDCLVERRQSKVLSTAERSTAIVSSLFPRKVADRLMKAEEEKKRLEREKAKRSKTKPVMLGQTPMVGMGKQFGVGSGSSVEDSQTEDITISLNDVEEAPSKPLAELFPSATVLFADIVGFTAWSSAREPPQVFELLEEIYSSFDTIARRKKVFKVETIGDCYMAATGLPEKRDDHAILMARFARDSLRKMLHVVRKLEVRLGPGTGDLGMRIGIHSGPVAAGVLRGEKARF